jgi:ATP-dependent Lhr-like helicase
VNPFDRLHPSLRFHIVNSLGWPSLRPVQKMAIDAVLAGENVILLAPTAGGKTEAAFFPLLSQTISENWSGLSVLYLSPIKALLNNQAERLQRYYQLVGREVRVWHGDVSHSVKRRLAQQPPDCLLTTPESVEAILVSASISHRALFHTLRAVVIDEAHAFAGDDRGWHLLFLLQRLQQIAGRELQRLGLSATVGNPEQLIDWVGIGSSRPGRVLRPPEELHPSRAQVQLDYVGNLANAAHVIAALHRGEKRLVFCDSRSRVEQLAALLRAAGVTTHVTHSSLSLDERRQAERAFGAGQNCVIVATSALELGIDVGDLHRVIQVDAPRTVSSFLQRMGRTGRRAEMTRNCLFLATSEQALLQAAGIIRLWESGYVEPVQPPPHPLHILAQQVMALVLEHQGVTLPECLATFDKVLAFAQLDTTQLQSVIRDLCDLGILWMDTGLLSFAVRGETRFGRRNFLELCSVFTAPPEFAILYGRENLGSVHESTFLTRHSNEPTVLLLAGHSWRVRYVDWSRRIASVEPAEVGGRSVWRGQGQHLSFALCRAIHEWLAADTEPDWLSRRARQQLAESRLRFDWLPPDTTCLRREQTGPFRWWTFGGGKANAALADALRAESGLEVRSHNFAVEFDGQTSLQMCLQGTEKLRERDLSTLSPDVDEAAISGLKFNDCLSGEVATSILRSRLVDREALGAILARRMHVILAEDG